MFWRRSGLTETPQCSFCHQGEDVVGELIGAPSNDSTASTHSSYICANCVVACSGILEDRTDAKIKKIMASRGMSPR
jgi:ClpX C4-type zinc finger